jgi:signal transduction histidine kinase/DNA-binding response OmpR family regulator
MNATAANSGNRIDQAEMRFLIEKNADGIIVVDADGIVQFANPAAEAIFGRRAHALVGSPIGIPLFAGETTEIAIHRPARDHVDAEIRAVETTWNNRPARLATLRDVSGRRAMEERLRHSAKMEAVGRLTAGIAHDFNNLLTVVLGNLESARRQSALAETALLRALENATHGARRAAGLTERLLAFARRKPLEPKITDINRLVSGMSDLLQRTLGEEIKVRTALASDLWRAEVDPMELETAILNLAVNARDAMPHGGELTIETANIELDTGGADNRMKAECVLVSVTDCGTGMTADVLKQVFEPFFTTKGGRGTGLGLSQVYGFVTQSGGHVELTSEPGIGTTAKLYLPKAEHVHGMAQRSVAEPERDQILGAVAGEAILVVEDDDDVRNYTVSSLHELGYTVFEAIDGASAIKILERESGVRLLFTDLGLPGGIDGKMLAERAVGIRPALRVVITTAYAASTLMHDGRLDPGIDLLSKPFTFASLARRMREVLDRSDDQEQPTFILLVEDEALLRMFVSGILAESGCQVEEAASFREALGKFRELGDKIDGAIIDLGLPDKPGDELVREIRASRPELPIVLATGYADDDVRQRFEQDKRLLIVNKPFNPNEIMDAFRRIRVPAKDV